MSEHPTLQVVDLKKTFSDGASQITVLQQINLRIDKADTIAIIGRSGSGKSTLLHLLGGLDLPSSGEIYIGTKKMHALSEKERGSLRNQMLGFIYQFHHLLPEFTALENVMMPLLIRGNRKNNASEQAAVLLQRVGLGARFSHRPSELSGGERQRVAIARALVNNPRYLLADEPTGNLDANSAEKIFELMLELNDEYDLSLIMVTHNISMANKMAQIFELQDGQLYPAAAS